MNARIKTQITNFQRQSASNQTCVLILALIKNLTTA